MAPIRSAHLAAWLADYMYVHIETTPTALPPLAFILQIFFSASATKTESIQGLALALCLWAAGVGGGGVLGCNSITSGSDEINRLLHLLHSRGGSGEKTVWVGATFTAYLPF